MHLSLMQLFLPVCTLCLEGVQDVPNALNLPPHPHGVLFIHLTVIFRHFNLPQFFGKRFPIHFSGCLLHMLRNLFRIMKRVNFKCCCSPDPFHSRALDELDDQRQACKVHPCPQVLQYLDHQCRQPIDFLPHEDHCWGQFSRAWVMIGLLGS